MKFLHQMYQSLIFFFPLLLLTHIEGVIGNFRFCGFGYFLDRFFGFCAKRLRFFDFGVRCGLRIFFFSIRFSVFVENNSGFSVLLSNVVFGFSYFESEVFGFGRIF